MGNLATDIRDEPGHMLQVHLKGIRWREVMGDDNHFPFDLGDIVMFLP